MSPPLTGTGLESRGYFFWLRPEIRIMKEKFKTENVENKTQGAVVAFLGLLLFGK